jgi:endonuclease-8
VVLSAPAVDAVQFGGAHLALRTEHELRSDPRLRALGPDVLNRGFEPGLGLAALRRVEQSRALGEVLLDQRVIAGIGNIYKSEGCYAARVDPWRRLADLGDDELLTVVDEIHSLMSTGLQQGRPPRRIYRQAGRPCPRCGTAIRSRGQGDANRITYWCPHCQDVGGREISSVWEEA